MNKNVLLLALTFCFCTLYAQDNPETPAVEAPKPESNWKFTFVSGLTGAQAYYSNWAAGGENSISLRAFVTTGGNFSKNRHSFSYFIDMALGYQWLFSNPIPLKKTDDKINLDVNYGYQISKKNNNFFYSAFINYKTQFANGFNDVHTQVISRFMAPGYLIYGLGVDYKLKDFLRVTVSPLSAKQTFVLSDSVWKYPNYGITQEMIDKGQHVKNEFGAYLKAFFNKDLTKAVNLTSQLTLFSNYLEKPQNIVVTFDLGFNFKITKFFSSGISFGYVYDDKVRFDITDKNGVVVKKGVPRSQFKESIYVGLVYKM